jgi:hypothetical protein
MRVAATLLVLVCAVPAAAQDPAPAARDVVSWAPDWKVGDRWEVKTYQKDRKEERASRKPVAGGMPYVPRDRSAELPDFPPLRDGVPIGYKVGNTWSMKVVREESVTYDDDEEGAAPERFFVVALKALKGSDPRSTELWFAAEDLVLSKVVLRPGEKKEEVHWLDGSVQLAVPAGKAIGFPLDWPDLKAAKKKEKVELQLDKKRKVEQRVRVIDKDEETAEYRLQLTRVTSKRDADRTPDARFVWRKGRPFWLRLKAGNLLAVSSPTR